MLVKLTGEVKVAAAFTCSESVMALPKMAAPVTLSTAFGAMLRLLCSCTGAWKLALAWKVEGAWKVEDDRKMEGARKLVRFWKVAGPWKVTLLWKVAGDWNEDGA